MSINNDVDGDNDDSEVSDRVNFDYENSIYIYSDDNDNSVEVNDVTNVDGFDSDDDDYNDDKGSSKKSCSTGILESSRLPGINTIFAMEY